MFKVAFSFISQRTEKIKLFSQYLIPERHESDSLSRNSIDFLFSAEGFEWDLNTIDKLTTLSTEMQNSSSLSKPTITKWTQRQEQCWKATKIILNTENIKKH